MNGARITDGVTFLMLAAKSSLSETEALLERGACINAKDASGRTALMYASAFNVDFEVINLLINSGACANARDNRGRTPLMYAAGNSVNPLVVRYLLKARAFVNARDAEGMTPLTFAVMRRTPNPNPDIVSELLSFGANPDVCFKGRQLESFAKDSPYLRGTKALRMLRAAG